VHAISSYRGNRLTNKQTHRQDRLQYTASAQCNNNNNIQTCIMRALSTLEAEFEALFDV